MHPRHVVFSLALCLALTVAALVAQAPPDRCLVPPAIRDPILNETSGERAHLHVQMLAGNRDRQAVEYTDVFFETTYIRDMAVQAGLSDVQVDLFPGRDAWDAEEGDLWMVQPALKKLASITTVPASLAIGSRNADVEAELVYVGSGREQDYAGKEVAGKIVLGSRVRRQRLRGRGEPERRGRRARHGSPALSRRGRPASRSTRSAGRACTRAPTEGGFGFATVPSPVPRAARPGRARPEGRAARARSFAQLPRAP